MAFYLSKIIGNGFDAEGNQYHPAIALYVNEWTMSIDGRVDPTLSSGWCLVETSLYDPAFDIDSRIRSMPSTLAEFESYGIPYSGETSELEIAEIVGKRLKLRRWVANLDLGILNLTLRDISANQRQKLKNRLLAHRAKIDISGINLATTIRDVLKIILPQIPINLSSSNPPSSAGTFTDNFTETSTVNLEDHTPSGGTAWTRTGGAAGDLKVSGSTDRVITGAVGAYYTCDNQGSPYQYSQFVTQSNAVSFAANRLVDFSNYIGFRYNSSSLQAYTVIGGSFTQKVNVAGSGVLRLESDSSDDHKLFDDGVQIGSTFNETNGNTETAQGLVARTNGVVGFVDDYEAGLLVVAGATLLPGFKNTNTFRHMIGR